MTDKTLDERAVKLLEDIRTAAQRLVDATEGRAFEEFFADEWNRLATERSFEVIGEAARRLRDEYPSVSGSLSGSPEVIGMRNRIAHGYDEIRYEVLWQTMRTKLPHLIEEVTREMGPQGA